jgi:hypothetical protein
VTGIYYTSMVDQARAAGLNVQVPSVCAGWERRARSSGGFPSAPLCVFWHHTASNTSPTNDLSYMINASDGPIGNWLIDRAGICYPIAAGASNCAGKGGPSAFSRGTVPADSGNTRGWQIEVANSGVGGAGGDWSQATIDAFFALSGVLNGMAGNRPDDIVSHALGAGDGYTNRKIDPARADCVAGSWRPRSTNSNGTWSLADMRAEANRRAAAPGPGPGPTPLPPGGADVIPQVIKGDATDSYYAWDGTVCSGIPSLEWVQWGKEAGLYQNTDPVVYPQGYVDQLVAAQGPR